MREPKPIHFFFLRSRHGTHENLDLHVTRVPMV